MSSSNEDKPKKMKNNIFKILLAILLPVQVFAYGYYIDDFDNVANEDRKKYIEKFKKIAMEEMDRMGIPASIKLAQGILESGDGKSELARKANNHFGMKCGGAWTGKTYFLKDDDYKNGVLVKSCFRVFKNAEASYRAHSEFLSDPRKSYRYGPLFDLDIYDYKSWARGLKKSGYATNPNYANLLIRIIEANNLYQYDRMRTNDIDEEYAGYVKDQIVKHNSVRMVFAENGDTPLDISERYRISTRRILRYNELTSSDETFKEGDRIYIQPKRSSWRGKKKYHRVEVGETMYDIAQKYAIKVRKLYRKNRMPAGAEPLKGELVSLRGRVKKDKIPKYEELSIRNDFDEDLPSLKSLLEDFIHTLPKKQEPDVELPNVGGDNGNVNGGQTGNNGTVQEDVVEFEEEEEKEEPSQPKAHYYTVKKGDTLYRISRMFKVSVEQIRLLNEMENNVIKVGQKLRVY